MKRVAPFLILVALLFPQTAVSQGVVIIEQWTVYRFVVTPLKQLPEGFHHFVPVPEKIANLLVPSEGNVLCNSLESVVAFGKRLWLGASPSEAVMTLMKLRGKADCAYISGLDLSPVEFAVRGDEKLRKIFIVRLEDQYGRSHLIGVPKTW